MKESTQIKSIFLVDDDVIFNLIHTKTVQREGFAELIESFVNGELAIGKLRHIIQEAPATFPDIIFLDINMPVMDGWEFLDEYASLPAAATSACCIYMLSSSIDPKDIERARTYKNVTDFISKPLTLEKMRAIFSNSCAVWAERKEKDEL